MIIFLTGWRRKCGCATLFMALTVTAVWIRSMSVVDWFRLPGAVVPGSKSQFSATLTTRGLELGQIWCDSDNTDMSARNGCWESYPANVYRSMHDFVCQIETHQNWLGFVIEQGKWGPISESSEFSGRITIWIIPYLLFIFPLTLTSTCLLLAKPHRRELGCSIQK